MNGMVTRDKNSEADLTSADTESDSTIVRCPKLSFWTKTTYASGAIPDVIFQNIIGVLATPIYNLALGVNPVLLGYALSIPRLWEGFTDPIMGNISDNTRARFG